MIQQFHFWVRIQNNWKQRFKQIYVYQSSEQHHWQQVKRSPNVHWQMPGILHRIFAFPTQFMCCSPNLQMDHGSWFGQGSSALRNEVSVPAGGDSRACSSPHSTKWGHKESKALCWHLDTWLTRRMNYEKKAHCLPALSVVIYYSSANWLTNNGETKNNPQLKRKD